MLRTGKWTSLSVDFFLLTILKFCFLGRYDEVSVFKPLTPVSRVCSDPAWQVAIMSRSFLVDSLIDNNSARLPTLPSPSPSYPPQHLNYLLGRLPGTKEEAPPPSSLLQTLYPKHLFQPFCCSISLTPHPHLPTRPRVLRPPPPTVTAEETPKDYKVKKEGASEVTGW